MIHGSPGRFIAIPTANVNFSRYARLPMEGVYVCQLQVGDTWYEAMGSIGHNDTFGEGRQLTMEINILDFHEEIYGETVNVRCLAFDSQPSEVQQCRGVNRSFKTRRRRNQSVFCLTAWYND